MGIYQVIGIRFRNFLLVKALLFKVGTIVIRRGTRREFKFLGRSLPQNCTNPQARNAAAAPPC